jgi:hypothetical protein
LPVDRNGLEVERSITGDPEPNQPRLDRPNPILPDGEWGTSLADQFPRVSVEDLDVERECSFLAAIGSVENLDRTDPSLLT